MQQTSAKTAFLAALFSLATTTAWFCTPTPVWSAPTEIRLSKGQTVYVPVYSNVFSCPRKRPLLLATTLSIRNTDRTADWSGVTLSDQ